MPFYNAPTLTPRDSIGYLLRRASKMSMARIEATFDVSDITFTQWIVLALIESGTATTCAELSRDLDHNSGAMTRLIDDLERRGLLVRRPDSDDRRISLLDLTESGQTTVQGLAARVTDVWNDLLGGFEHAEIVQLIALLNRLVAILDTVQDQKD